MKLRDLSPTATALTIIVVGSLLGCLGPGCGDRISVRDTVQAANYQEGACEDVMCRDDTCTVLPTGNRNGIKDADRIACALNKFTGSIKGKVRLTKGHYYVSRSIVVYGFNGTLHGAGKDRTIIEAVRKSNSMGHGFQGTLMPIGFEVPVMFVFRSSDPADPAHFAPTQYVGLEDLTLQVTDPHPADPWWFPYVNQEGETTTAMGPMFVNDVGSTYDTVIRNVRMKGSSGDAIATMFHNDPHFSGKGKNIVYGAVIRRGSFFGGRTIIENSDFENFADNAVETYFMSGSQVRVANNSFYEVCGSGIWNGQWWVENPSTFEFEGNRFNLDAEFAIVVFDSNFLQDNGKKVGLLVRNNTISGRYRDSAIKLVDVAGAAVTGNRLVDIELAPSPEGSTPAGIRLTNRDNYSWEPYGPGAIGNTIANNEFKNLTATCPNCSAVFLDEKSAGNTLTENDYTGSGLMGWNAAKSQFNGAVMLVATTSGNIVQESQFPDRRAVCDEVYDLTDNASTPRYDGLNTVPDWNRCVRGRSQERVRPE
jgi:hypothetical protein